MARAKQAAEAVEEIAVPEVVEETPVPRVRVRIEGSFEIDLDQYPGVTTTDEAAAVDQATYDADEVGPEDVLSWISNEPGFSITFEGVQ